MKKEKNALSTNYFVPLYCAFSCSDVKNDLYTLSLIALETLGSYTLLQLALMPDISQHNISHDDNTLMEIIHIVKLLLKYYRDKFRPDKENTKTVGMKVNLHCNFSCLLSLHCI